MSPLKSVRPVICAVENTEVARHAAVAADWLGRALDAPVLLAHVFDPWGISVPPAKDLAGTLTTTEDLEREARQRAHRLVGEAARAIGGQVRTEVPEGKPVSGILRLAAARHATFVIMGTAARAGLDRVLIGSVSSEVAAGAPCPVVAVPPGAALAEPGPVVAGYDGSEHSLRAARHAAALAAQLDRDLVLVHVKGRGAEGLKSDAELGRELFTAATGALGKQPGRPRLDLDVSLAVQDGEPVEILARVCGERQAPLVVVGTRGRNVLTGSLLGSVSAGLVREAGRPVVLVPASAGDTPEGPSYRPHLEAE